MSSTHIGEIVHSRRERLCDHCYATQGVCGATSAPPIGPSKRCLPHVSKGDPRRATTRCVPATRGAPKTKSETPEYDRRDQPVEARGSGVTAVTTLDIGVPTRMVITRLPISGGVGAWSSLTDDHDKQAPGEEHTGTPYLPGS
jgi:hypothetical protein